MRGHRSRLQNLALALLLGAAGASSSGLVGTPVPAAADRSASDWTLAADRALAWGEATEPLRGFGSTYSAPVGSGDGGSPRAGRASLSQRVEPVLGATTSAEGVRDLPLAISTGARLLGLAASPANAPPGS